VRRILPDGRVLDVEPLTFGRARLIISVDEAALWYLDGW
jgi:hypothetical protein